MRGSALRSDRPPTEDLVELELRAPAYSGAPEQGQGKRLCHTKGVAGVAAAAAAKGR
jgi:hypothetical protein